MNMFKLATSVRSTQQALAMFVAVAILLWSVGAYTTTQAANLLDVSNLITDSAPSATPAHTITFEVPADSDISGDITVEFPAGFTGVAGIDDTNTNVSGGSGTAVLSIVGNTLTIEGITAPGSAVITIEIEEDVITNPGDDGSYRFTITTDTTDDGPDIGKTHVYIIDTVLVTASVETVFEFEIRGVNASTTPTDLELTTGTSTATSIPFGVITPGDAKFMAQDLLVTTNARNGYIVTVEQDGPLISSNSAIISSFIDGAYTNASTTWIAPSGDVFDDETWGHWGLTSNDATLDSLHSPFGLTGGYVAASTTPRLVMAHDASADGNLNETQNIGLATVGYKVEITPLQEAAEDYTTTLTYIATPTF